MWLSGIGLVFQIIFYILVGAGCILFAVFGGAHYISTMMTHDETCSCNQCQSKRQKKWRAKHGNPLDVVIPTAQKPYKDDGGWWIDDKSKAPMGETWMSTVELQEGMRVLGRAAGTIFTVKEIAAREYGFVVILHNPLTDKDSWIQVSIATAHHRIWLVRPSRRSKGNGNRR